MKKTVEEEIELIKKRMNIKEETTRKHEYGCVMLYFDFPEIKDVHRTLDKNDIYIDPNDDSYGLETEPHTTLLFGLHEGVSTENVGKVLANHTYESCEIYNASVFKNEKYDVLKFDVKGEGLNETNEDLKHFPYTSDFPEFHPHMTIAYLKPGTGEKYANKLKEEEFWLMPQYAVYSKTDGTKVKIAIRVD